MERGSGGTVKSESVGKAVAYDGQWYQVRWREDRVVW